jgi:hypothetical protein
MKSFQKEFHSAFAGLSFQCLLILLPTDLKFHDYTTTVIDDVKAIRTLRRKGSRTNK